MIRQGYSATEIETISMNHTIKYTQYDLEEKFSDFVPLAADALFPGWDCLLLYCYMVCKEKRLNQTRFKRSMSQVIIGSVGYT